MMMMMMTWLSVVVGVVGGQVEEWHEAEQYGGLMREVRDRRNKG